MGRKPELLTRLRARDGARPGGNRAADDAFLDTLCAAPARGVEVDLLLPGPHADKRVCQLASESIYSTLVDELITPNATAPLIDGASNLHLQALCAARPVTHVSIVAQSGARGRSAPGSRA